MMSSGKHFQQGRDILRLPSSRAMVSYWVDTEHTFDAFAGWQKCPQCKFKSSQLPDENLKNIFIARSILDDRKGYQSAVHSYLRQKFGPKICEIELTKFSKYYTSSICSLLNQHRKISCNKREERMLKSKSHEVFFNSAISLNTLLKVGEFQKEILNFFQTQDLRCSNPLLKKFNSNCLFSRLNRQFELVPNIWKLKEIELLFENFLPLIQKA